MEASEEARDAAGMSGSDSIFRLRREEIVAIQERRLGELLAAVVGPNAFQTRRLAGAGTLAEIAGIAGPSGTDLAASARVPLAALPLFPFTTKDELLADQAEHPPYGSNLTHPLARYVRLHQSSGTKGRPLRWLDTPESWEWFRHCWGLIYDAAGVRPGDRFFFPFSFGPFLAFWAGFESAVARGHLTLPGGGMTTRARLDFLVANEADVVACTPTYALHMAEVAAREGIDLAGSAVRTLIVAGEPGGNVPEVKRRLETAWGARCIDHSGMTEIGSLGVEHRDNPGDLYLLETECIVEIVDAEGLPVEPGARGELVLTNLGRPGSPLIRYRTGDLVEAAPDPCPLGSALTRLRGGILGRLDDMAVVRGNNLYPAALDSVLRRIPEVVEYRAEVFSRDGLAVLSLTIEASEGPGGDAGTLAEAVASAVRDAFHFRPEVVIAPPGSLPRFELKASRFVVHPSYRAGAN